MARGNTPAGKIGKACETTDTRREIIKIDTPGNWYLRAELVEVEYEWSYICGIGRTGDTLSGHECLEVAYSVLPLYSSSR